MGNALSLDLDLLGEIVDILLCTLECPEGFHLPWLFLVPDLAKAGWAIQRAEALPGMEKTL